MKKAKSTILNEITYFTFSNFSDLYLPIYLIIRELWISKMIRDGLDNSHNQRDYSLTKLENVKYVISINIVDFVFFHVF